MGLLLVWGDKELIFFLGRSWERFVFLKWVLNNLLMMFLRGLCFIDEDFDFVGDFEREGVIIGVFGLFLFNWELVL